MPITYISSPKKDDEDTKDLIELGEEFYMNMGDYNTLGDNELFVSDIPHSITLGTGHDKADVSKKTTVSKKNTVKNEDKPSSNAVEVSTENKVKGSTKKTRGKKRNNSEGKNQFLSHL